VWFYCAAWGERELSGLAGGAERLQVLRARTIGHRVRHIHDCLRRLPDRYGADHCVRRRIDRDELIRIPKPDIHPGAVASRPQPMRH